MLEIDDTFPRAYEVSEVGEWPGMGTFSIPTRYFPPPRKRPEHDGWWLRLKGVNGKSWIGVFAFAYTSPPAISRVLTTPDPERVCVIARGGAYIVAVDEPEVWEEVRLVPVLDVRPIPQHKLLLFADFTELAAYGGDGLVWRSPRLCWDELKILSVGQDTVECTGYGPTEPGESGFKVDLRTGRCLGSSGILS